MYEHVTLGDNSPLEPILLSFRFNFITFRWLMRVRRREMRRKKAKLMQRLTWFIATLHMRFLASFFYEPRGVWWICNGSVLSTALKLWFTNCEINIKFSITQRRLQGNFGLTFSMQLPPESRPGCPSTSTGQSGAKENRSCRSTGSTCLQFVWPLKEIVCKNVAVFLFARYLKLNYWTH